MPTVDEILAGSPLAGLRRISPGGGDREVAVVRLAERFAELDDAPPGSFVVLSRLASAEVTDYRLDMALRWAAIRRVAAVAAFSAEAWQPAVTALDIAEHADIALVSVPAEVGIPDGLAVDADGCVWLAIWGVGSVHRYTPAGVLDGVLDVPASNVTSCAFGGAGLADLFVTTASRGLSPAQLAEQPLAGGIFRATPGVVGLEPQGYAG